MASNIDPTQPVFGTTATADTRSNFQAAKDEIEALQALPSSGITSTDIGNWNTAFGWGDHSAEGYLTDAPSDGNAYGRQDGAWAQVLVTETDPVFSASPASGIASGDITNWNTAFGWGDHAGLYDAAGSAQTVQDNLDTHTADGNPHLSVDERNAMTAANAPSDTNPIATINDIPAPGTPDLTDAVFPTYLGFDEIIAATSTVDFSTGNVQEITGSAGDITLANGPAVQPCLLIVSDSTTITSITDAGGGTVEWLGGAPTFSGKAVISCLYTGNGWLLDFGGDVA